MVKNKSISEKRGCIRAKRILSIRHRLYKRRGKIFQNAEWHLSTTEDMSATGLRFATAQPYQEKDMVELHVVMSGILDIFRGYGKVVRVQKKTAGVIYQVGLAYTTLKPKLKRQAKGYPQKLVPSKKRK